MSHIVNTTSILRCAYQKFDHIILGPKTYAKKMTFNFITLKNFFWYYWFGIIGMIFVLPWA